MKVAIIGSRGIPNRYGGFEELAERLALGLGAKSHEVVVYNPHNHPVKNFKAAGVRIVKVLNPEPFMGTFGQFIYDLLASLHTWFVKPDIILQLGYTSSSVWYKLLPPKSRIITNMDGLEWKRNKYSSWVKKFLKQAEKWAARQSHLLVADHPEIEAYIHKICNSQVVYIPYGADIPKKSDEAVLEKLKLKPKQYHLLIARMEPENHVEEVLRGVVESTSNLPVVVVGSLKNTYGRKLQKMFRGHQKVIFTGSIYQKEKLNALRSHAFFYFHGHSVGGTNPSLLEAMACGCNIIAHKNIYNKGVLGDHALYFESAGDILALLNGEFHKTHWQSRSRKNISAIRDRYNWQIVIDQYELAMKQLLIK